MAVRIVTDSTADIPSSIASELGVIVVPLTVHFGDEVYRDGIDLEADSFLAKLTSSSVLPHTAQPSPAAFAQVYQPLLDQGDQVLSIHISAKISGTTNSALLARQEVGGLDRIQIIDSKWTSMALGIVVRKAAHAAQQGGSPDEVLRTTEEAIQGMQLLLFCDTLEYLQKGGRIGKAAAFLGGLLNVKPLLTLQDGEVRPVERVRTRQRALERLWDWAQDFPALQEFCVLHCGCLDDAQTLQSLLAQRFPQARSQMTSIGPVIGTHLGPGAVGIALLP